MALFFKCYFVISCNPLPFKDISAKNEPKTVLFEENRFFLNFQMEGKKILCIFTPLFSGMT